MLRYRIDSYTKNNEINETTGMVTYWDHLGAESSSQPFKFESVDGEFIDEQLRQGALKYDQDNIAAAAAAAASETIDGIDEGTVVEFDDDLSTGEGGVTGVVFRDDDMDGIFNDVARMVGVSVGLYLAANDELIDTVNTNANGIYAFSSVENGEYYLVFTAPSGYAITLQDQGKDDTLDSDANVVTGKTANFTVAADEVVTGIDCGMYQLASVSGTVWLDEDHDGIHDAGETTGWENVAVELRLASDDSVVDDTTTNASGNYSFANVPPAVEYYINIAAPDGYAFSLQDQGEDDTVDSDVSIATGNTATFTPTVGQSITHIDAGIYQLLAHITGSLFDDWDRDGTWDTPDEANFMLGTTVEVCYSVNDVVANSVVTTSGTYDLTVVPGDYYVKVTPPTYWQLSPYSPIAGDTDIDDATSKSTNFSVSGGDTVTKDAGLMHERGYVDAHVFIDDGVGGGTANNGVQDGTEINSIGTEVYLRVTNHQGGFWDAYPDPVTGDIHLQVHTGINLTATWTFVGGYATGYHMTGLVSNPETGITVTKDGTTDLGDRGIAADV